MILSADSFTDALSDVSNQLALGDRDRELADQIAADQATLATIHQTVVDTTAATEDLRVQTAAQKASLDVKLADLKPGQGPAQDPPGRDEAPAGAPEGGLPEARPEQGRRPPRSWPQEAKAAKSVKRKIDRLVAAQFAERQHPVGLQRVASTGRSPASSPRSSAAPASGRSRRSATAPTSTAASTSPTRCTPPIRAAGAGRVVYEGPLSDGAWVVIIAHSKDLVTLYGHVDNRHHPPVVRAGQLVSQGQIIAYVGITGNSTGPHLHWGVEFHDTWVNPRLFV